MTRQQRLPGVGSGEDGPVTCLGQTFESEDARRDYYLDRLAEHLKDPEFRNQPGFPKGTDEAILRMSDPPYYTACPNPFFREIAAHICTPYDPEIDDYERVPIADNMEEGRTHRLYNAHSYHTKVPHLAIAPYVLHYTRPGDVILDGFAGSGMTGVGVQFSAGIGPAKDREKVELKMAEFGLPRPNWGNRHVILNDLAPAATFIGSNYTTPFDVDEFENEATRILEEVDSEIGWMYETTHTDGRKGTINYTVWSDIFACGVCHGDIVFLNEALDKTTNRVKEEFNCPHCNSIMTKKRLQILEETIHDSALQTSIKVTRRCPVLIEYNIGKDTFSKIPDAEDLAIIRKIEKLSFPYNFPSDRMMHASESTEKWGDKWRRGTANFTHVHHLYTSRARQAISLLLEKVNFTTPHRNRQFLYFWIEQYFLTSSFLNRYRSNQGSQTNQILSGVYYIPSQIAETSVSYRLSAKIKQLAKTFREFRTVPGTSFLQTGTCSEIGLPGNSVDYIFTDPPFGHNLAYAELNFVVEAFHGVFTHQPDEAIVSKHQEKDVEDYRELMLDCFKEYHRVLKPGRWMTIVFSNSQASVWNAINESLLQAGFVVSNVRGFSKKQKAFNAVQGVYVDHDLTITVYKPREGTVEAMLTGSGDGVWAMMDEHLAHLPLWIGTETQLVVDLERTPDHLYDRLVAMHLVRRHRLDLNKLEFIAGLPERYQEREGMFFLASQVPQFERKMLSVDRSEGVLPVFLDRRSAIAWLRAELGSTPTTLQKLTPRFMQASSAWADKNEPLPELLEILQDNFVEGENGRWKVPDPKNQAELERAKRQRDLRKAQDWAGAQGRGGVPSIDAIRTLLDWILEEDRLDIYSSIKGRIPAGFLEDETVSMLVFVLNGRLNS